jgi:hypothetical protein
MNIRNCNFMKKLNLAIVLSYVWLLAGCSVTTKLTSPLPVNISAAKTDEAIGLYIPDASKQYVWKGNINVATYNVEFGNALEANAKHALSKVFRDVSVIDHFPPASTTGERAVSVEIEDAQVSPGALTFLSTSADVRLKAIIAEGGQAVGSPISVQGQAEASPGAMGANPILGMNQAAYDGALQEASEKAMTSALEQLIDAISKQHRAAR